MNGRTLVWFSCGAASAVAAKLTVDSDPDCEVLYCDTLAYEHPDNIRFLRDVEVWLGKPITLLSNPKYKDIYDVFEKSRYLVGVNGASCTRELKKNVRKAYAQEGDINVFGLTLEEKARADRFELQNAVLAEFPLIDAGTTKSDCYRILQEAGVKLPEMYLLGYNNNNCIGCVKGGAGYWNKIRVDFPESFNKMAKMERKLNVAINKRYDSENRIRVFLDELDPKAGRNVPLPDIECGALCIRDRKSVDE